MSEKDNLSDFKEIKLNVQEKFKEIIGETKEFPKYTTQIINIANQNAQGTRPEVVGQMSELINRCPEKTYKSWKEWYLKNYPDAIKKATQRVKPMIDNIKEAIELIDEKMVEDWVEDLVITKTAEGLVIQEIILEYIANKKGIKWRLATPYEESQNIDGYIGEIPVSIKPSAYLAKKSSVRETIYVEMIYYKKTVKFLYIYTKL
ncbi:putative type-2 restriction enzyme MthZI [uncultured archaeon]|nr:putative type-2 restriction enzyme MthZI [uncultured archaeon]